MLQLDVAQMLDVYCYSTVVTLVELATYLLLLYFGQIERHLFCRKQESLIFLKYKYKSTSFR